MTDDDSSVIPTGIPYTPYYDLYTIMYGKRVVDIVPDTAYPSRSTIKFADGTESKAWVTPPKEKTNDI